MLTSLLAAYATAGPKTATTYEVSMNYHNRKPTLPSLPKMKPSLQKDIVVKQTAGLDLIFDGRKLGYVSTYTKNPPADRPQWTELSIYTTAACSFVCVEASFSYKDRSERFRKVTVAPGEADVIHFFGEGPLAKRLYEKAGITAVMRID